MSHEGISLVAFFTAVPRRNAMIQLTAEQRLELTADAPRAIDPETHIRYVLVREEMYERLEALLTPGRLTDSEQQAALDLAGVRAGWDDPEMDVYDREEPERQP
jgi:hypothetical protein